MPHELCILYTQLKRIDEELHGRFRTFVVELMQTYQEDADCVSKLHGEVQKVDMQMQSVRDRVLVPFGV